MSAGELTPPVGPEDHVAGPDDAPVTLVEYGDYECPHCAAAHPVVKAVLRRMGKQVRFVFRNFPLKEVHPHAYHAAEVAEAAAVQGRFWEMHDIIFQRQHEIEDADLLRYAKELKLDVDRVRSELEAGTHTKRVRDDFRHGVRSGVNGTPTFFINGRRYDGVWRDEDAFVGALKAAARAHQAG